MADIHPGLSPSLQLQLHQMGLHSYKDILKCNPLQLIKDLQLSAEIVNELILKCQEREKMSSTKDVHAMTLKQALEKSRALHPITTSSQQLDHLLGGGIPLGKITEFCGAPGIGKTQLGIQLCVNVQIPQSLGGLQGEAIYIDTEGSFMVDRVSDIAMGLCDYAQQATKNPQALSLESILSKIYLFRIYDYIENVAMINILEDFIQSHSQVKLIVLDSIAFHFRHNFKDMALRQRLLTNMIQTLAKIATRRSIAVVLVNQMTTKFSVSSNGEQEVKLVPALGESWGHMCANRILLFWRDKERYASIIKSANLEEKMAKFTIKAEGIRDDTSQ